MSWPADANEHDVATSMFSVASPVASVRLAALLRVAVTSGASDLHLASGHGPLLRVDGDLTPLTPDEPVPDAELRETIDDLLNVEQRRRFHDDGEVDFGYESSDGHGFRMNAYRHSKGVGLAARLIPSQLRTLDEMGVPSVVSSFAGLPRGLVLITGTTGSGKSTTMAALIDEINRTRRCHVLTVEDPIEFRHRSQTAMVTQREIGQHSASFPSALRNALREDPDVILIGEMRDSETIRIALTAAETGHLVLATLHAQDCALALDRVIDVFPAEQQDQVRAQLASALQGVVAQVLCRHASGSGRIVAVEVMVATLAVRALLREGRAHQIYSMLHSGKAEGMRTLDQSLAELVRRGQITFEEGLAHCRMADEYAQLCGRSAKMIGRPGAAREDARYGAAAL